MKRFVKWILSCLRLLEIIQNIHFKLRYRNSGDYWQMRYAKGGTSGSGSYGELAAYKAEIINSLIEKESIDTVVEWGVGDGNQLSYLMCKTYLGLDVSQAAIDICKKRFEGDSSKTFCVVGDDFTLMKKFDLSLSLDVIFHLTENRVFEAYIKNLFKSSNRFVCIYSSNFIRERTMHEKHRNFTEYIERTVRNFDLMEVIKNRYPFDPTRASETSISDFYIYKKT